MIFYFYIHKIIMQLHSDIKLESTNNRGSFSNHSKLQKIRVLYIVFTATDSSNTIELDELDKIAPQVIPFFF
jgi:hypothetical protein